MKTKPQIIQLLENQWNINNQTSIITTSLHDQFAIQKHNNHSISSNQYAIISLQNPKSQFHTTLIQKNITLKMKVSLTLTLDWWNRLLLRKLDSLLWLLLSLQQPLFSLSLLGFTWKTSPLLPFSSFTRNTSSPFIYPLNFLLLNSYSIPRAS